MVVVDGADGDLAADLQAIFADLQERLGLAKGLDNQSAVLEIAHSLERGNLGDRNIYEIALKWAYVHKERGISPIDSGLYTCINTSHDPVVVQL